MAKYDIVGGIVSDAAMKQLQEIEKLATSIGKSLQGVKLSDLSKGGKDAANLEKINAQTQLLVEKSKTLEQQREKAAAKSKQNEIARLSAIDKENTAEEIAHQKRLSRDAKILMQKTETEQKLLNLKQKADDKQRESSRIVIDTTNYELQAMNRYYAELEKSSAIAAANKEKQRAASKVVIDDTNYELQAMNKYYSELEKSSAKEAAAATEAADEKRRAQEAVAAANEKARKSTADYKVGVSALSNVEKLKAVITSEHTTSLQKLGAQMRLVEIEMQAKFNPALAEQEQEFRNLNAQHKAMQQEFNRTARATGVMGRSSKSAYGSFFQMTQVMRELPNFAIDARIGFMALSNNLPMLADEFKAVRQEIIDTKGAAGATGKAWAALGKSLLSLNTIMIVASTLLVLFGDDITKFIGQVFSGEKAMKALSVAALGVKTSLTVMRDALSGSEMQKSIESINKLSSNLENAKGNAKESEYYVGEFNNTLGVTFGKAKDVNEALALIDANKDAYIEAMKQMTFANTLFAKSAEYMTKIVEVNMKPQGQIVREAGGDYKKMYEQYQEFNNEIEKAQKEKEKGINPNATVMIGGVFGTAYSLDGAKKARSKLAKEINDIEKKERDRQISIYTKGMNSMEEEARKAAKAMSDIWDENGWGFPVTPERGDKAKVIIREIGAEMKKLSAIDVETLVFKNIQSPTAKKPSIGGDVTQSMNSQLASLNEQYANGILSYKDYLRQRVELTTIAGEANVEIQESINQEMAENDKNHQQEMLEFTAEMAMLTADLLNEVWAAFFDIYLEKLEEQSEMFKKVEDEKYKDIEDREKAGVLTKQEAEEEKLRTQTYYDSVQEELDEKKKRADKDKFLFEQAMAVANIWINAAVASAGAQNLAVFGAFTPLYAAIAAAQTAIVLAQSIPAFEQGGIVAKDGTILAGEKRHELAILPDGSFFVTANRPTLYDVPKGTEIMPDLNKIDIMDILHLKPLYANHSDDKQLIREMQNVTRAIKTQKQGNFYGMPLIKQLDSRGRFDSRRKSLMN